MMSFGCGKRQRNLIAGMFCIVWVDAMFAPGVSVASDIQMVPREVRGSRRESAVSGASPSGTCPTLPDTT